MVKKKYTIGKINQITSVEFKIFEISNIYKLKLREIKETCNTDQELNPN